VQNANYLTADNSVFQYSNANDMTQDLNSFGEIIAHAQCSFYLFNRYLFVEIESKEGRKTA
jgi:hypothetical protein